MAANVIFGVVIIIKAMGSLMVYSVLLRVIKHLTYLKLIIMMMRFLY